MPKLRPFPALGPLRAPSARLVQESFRRYNTSLESGNALDRWAYITLDAGLDTGDADAQAAVSSVRMHPDPANGGGPIFLAGADRSGIGLLGEVLECHPHVSMTRRTNFWDYYDGRFGDLSETDNLERCLDALARDRRTRPFEPDRAEVRELLTQGPATYDALFEILHLQLMQRRGRRRWGDKSLGSERHAERILSAYPSARMVHVLRDPRDRYSSQKHHRASGRGGAGAGAALWRRSEALATSNAMRFSGRYLVVRYEDLVDNADAVLDDVGSFFGLDPVDDAHLLPHPRPLTSSSVGRHLTDISSEERRFLELANRRGMRRRGYQPTPVTMSLAERVRFWIGTFPVHVCTGVLSRVADTIRDKRGRSPRPRRSDLHQAEEG